MKLFSRVCLTLAVLGSLLTVPFAQVERGAPLARKGALGAQLAPATADEAKAAGKASAVKIAAVLPGLTAEKAKLQAGDVLLTIAGQAVAGPAEVGPIISQQTSGKPIKFEVFRAGQKVVLEANLAERPRQKEDGFKVIYDQVMSKGKRIRMIITHPEGKGPFPTLFLIGGIGAYSVDGDFGSIAYGNVIGPIAKAGFATVRIDKPGQGDSEGPVYTDLLFDDELDAYIQAVRLAKTIPVIDANKIAIWGHSMGGCFGPLLAAQEKIAGLSVNGTVSKTWVEYQSENTRRQALLSGATPSQVDDEMRSQIAISHFIFNESLSPAEAIAKYPNWATAIKANFPDGKTYSGVGIAFFQQLAKKNLMEAWEKADTKILVTYGENDFLSGREDHEFIVNSVNALRPGTAEFKLLTNSDHGFFETTSQKDSLTRWRMAGKKFNPSIVTTLEEWLKKILA
jgi:uncharacterized protein